jgi:antitoxin VapB
MVMVNLTLENLGRRLVIEAASPRSLLAVLATLRPLEEDFPPIEELPLDAVDL